MIDFNLKAKEIFEQNKAAGWWDDMNRCIYQTLQLVNTEIAEATEGARKNLMDDHLPHRKMEEVELADALIRMLDIAGRCGWSIRASFSYEKLLTAAERKKALNETAGKAHLGLSKAVCDLSDIVDENDPYGENCFADEIYMAFVVTLLIYSLSKGYDVIAAMNEKLEYNKNRADHKRENRAKEGGKAF